MCTLRLLFIVSSLTTTFASAQYAGSEVCERCHQAIYESQAKTAMANTWHGKTAPLGPLKVDEGRTLHYDVHEAGDGIAFSVAGLAKEKLTARVSAIVGGKRHGLSFLLGVDQLAGISLERPAMLEARYASSGLGTLVLSPGFLKDFPTNYEDAFGRVLSPTFEQRCLTCHGEPGTLGAGKQGGVRCESCHGAAAEHVASMTSGHAAVLPAKLAGSKIMEVCSQCHSGLGTVPNSDPIPEDMVVSDQVPALEHSECFIQSGEKITCTLCHNPHQDSTTLEQSSVGVCLSCHSLSAPQHAAICPVNRTQGCVGCHMPSVTTDSFHLADHWIRVIPGRNVKTGPRDESMRSQVIPNREFLRLIAVDDAEKMKAVRERLNKGDDFSAVAHDLSMDGSAPGGGYIGDMKLADMDAKLAQAAAHLPYGGISDVVETGNAWMILSRQPRDFKWQASQLFNEATALHERGDRVGAIEKNRQALQVYPYFLRALVLMGTMLGEAGNAPRAAEVLRFAAQSYPRDPYSEFNLGLTLGKRPVEQIEAFRKTIELDPDMVAAYQSLGAALYSSGQANAAIETFRRGLQIDPLSAVLYYDLSLALREQGDKSGADKALALAAALDRGIAARKAP